MSTVSVFFKTEFSADRQVIAIANTSDVDNVDEVVVPSGVMLDEHGNLAYMNEAKAVYYNHGYAMNPDAMPIGTHRTGQVIKSARAESIRVVFRMSDATQQARDVYSLMREGAIRGISIGFDSRDYGAPDENEIKRYGPVRTVHRRWLMLEYSVTPMPCNPKCWVESMKGVRRPVLDDGQVAAVRSLARDGVIAKSWLDEFGVSSGKRVVILG